MSDDSRPTIRHPHILATDLDGTLIPLPENSQNRSDLKVIRELLVARAVTLTFVTGRHLAIVEEAMDQHQLPRPDWIICDVGSTIYRRSSSGWDVSCDYADHLDSLCKGLSIDQLRHQLSSIADLALQEDEKQGPFKLSYYVSRHDLQSISSCIDAWLTENHAPYSMISSVDPFTENGLIDLLPTGVSKAYAIEWWRAHCGVEREAIVFAGDSGNDLTALSAGYLSIVVANADRKLASQVAEDHRKQDFTDRLHLASMPATSGVLEGCRAFGLFEE